MGILNKLFGKKRVFKLADDPASSERCACGRMGIGTHEMGNNCFSYCFRCGSKYVLGLGLFGKCPTCNDWLEFQYWKKPSRKKIDEQEERKMREFWPVKQLSQCTSSGGEITCNLTLIDKDGFQVALYVTNPLDIKFISMTTDPVQLGLYFQKQLNAINYRMQEPAKELKGFWCTKYSWSTYPDFFGNSLQVVLESHDGNKIEFILTDPLDIYFIHNIKSMELVGIHFKDKLKEFGYEVKEPSPDQLCNHCGKYYFTHQMSNFYGMCIYCRKDRDDRLEARGYVECNTCGKTGIHTHTGDKKDTYYRKKVELLEEKLKWHSNYSNLMNNESVIHKNIINDINKKLEALETSHGC